RRGCLMRRSLTSIACLLAMAGALVVEGAVPASAETVTGTIDASAPKNFGHSSPRLGLGKDGTTKGALCAALLVWAAHRDNGMALDVAPQGEALCERMNGTVVKCAGARFTATSFDGTRSGDPAFSTSTLRCGSYGGSTCPSNARFFGSAPAGAVAVFPIA